MKSRRVRILVICAAVVLCIGIYIFYRPIPIIEEKYLEDAEITMVIEWLGGTKNAMRAVYNEEELVNYLHSCKMRRSLFVTESRMLDDYKITMFVHYSGGSRHIWIGDKNICTGRTGHWGGRYRILNAKKVLTELFSYIDTEHDITAYFN